MEKLRLTPEYKEFVELLNSHKVEYLIIGGFAVCYYGYVRYTGDIDIWVNPTKGNAENLVKALNEFGFASLKNSSNELCTEGYVFQLGYEPNRIDIITSATGLVFDECFNKKERMEFEGIEINFIDIQNLIKNKNATGRAQDIADVKNLSK